MAKIGILAYGSLIEEPGPEIGPLIDDRINVWTPFNIEFARKSSSRDDAPTVIPVVGYGAPVNAVILVLREGSVGLQEAMNRLWRRETRKEGTGKPYKRPENPGPNHVLVDVAENLGGVDTVLYTRIGTNIPDSERTPENLAKLAIDSAMAGAGKEGKDGISYLLSLKNQGIETPLMRAYEKHILLLTKTDSLQAALESAKNGTHVS